MKPGWLYRPSDRAILHRPTKDSPPIVVGIVPKVTGIVVHLTDDGQPIRTEYQVLGARQRRKRILTEDELDRGTWAAKLGLPRPSGNDARQAFGILIRRQAEDVPEVPARSYYNEAGDLVLPDPDAQPFGYLTCAGTEKDAREAWDEIGAWTCIDPNAALVLGAVFVGPILDRLEVLAHIVNLIGPGQQGKSTALYVGASTLGDIKPRRQKLLMTWNASKQGITQSLRQRGYLPVALDEHSSSGRTVKESSREFSQIVAGAIREMGTADGSPRESDGFWHSVLLSSSNDPLKYAGQSEDLATRLQEIATPFFPNTWVNSEGTHADPGSGAAEHLSKRLKRLAKASGGWPLVWAVQGGMFRAANLAKLKQLHMDLCAKHAPHSGGIPDTIAEIHMAWVVGAHLLGAAIGGDVAEELGRTAEAAAAERLSSAIQAAAEANISDGDQLWNALDSLRIERSAYPEMEELPSATKDGFHKVKGFIQADKGWWWVVRDVVKEAAASEGLDNLSAALGQLHERRILLRENGDSNTTRLPSGLRQKYNLSSRMYCFDTRRADELFAPDDPQDSSVPVQDSPQDSSRTGPTVLENEALTSGRTVRTVRTGLSETHTHSAREAAPVQTSIRLTLERLAPPAAFEGAPVDEDGGQRGDVGSWRHDATNGQHSAEVATLYPAPVAAVADDAFADLAAKAHGRTRSALRFAVLGADDATGPALWLPNCAPVPVRLPGHVDDVPGLMDAYELKTLWIHASAAEAMGLPTFEERRGLPPLGPVGQDQDDDGQDEAEQQPGRAFSNVGPQTPVVHSWATPGAGSSIVSMAPAGLASWLTLVLPDGDSERRLNVALPLYDNRYDKDRQRGGFGGAPTPAVMLDALMVWTLATVHGPAGRPQVIPFYASVNRTAQDFAGGRFRDDVLCEAVRGQEITPLLRNAVPLMVPQQWGRPLTEDELSLGYLHQFDKTAAWLGSFSACPLGIGEPVHADQGADYDPRLPGFWRVAGVPGTGPAGLPPLRFREDAAGGYWISTPSMDLLIELYPGWTPDVLESWYWPEHKRALESMYDKVRIARLRTVAAIEAGRPGAKFAKVLVGRTYQSFRGYMARSDGPMTDHATGGDYKQDIYYRPDWARLIMDLATANMYRNLVKFAADGVVPLAVCVDALTWASAEADPAEARPASMVNGKAQWTHEGTAAIGELLAELATITQIGAGRTAHHILTDYIDARKVA